MKLLRELADQTAIPELAFNQVKSNIRKGAADLEQKWPNALALTTKAYEVANVEMPTPADIAGYKQFEQLLRFAVAELAKTRGIDGDWRLSVRLPDKINEQVIKDLTFKVIVQGKDDEDSYRVKAPNVQSIIAIFKKSYPESNFVISDYTQSEDSSGRNTIKGKQVEVFSKITDSPTGVTLKIIPIKTNTLDG